MKKWLILLIIMIAALPLVTGAMCQKTIKIGETCTMLTPVISCDSYTYEIYNTTRNVTTGNMVLIEDGIYKYEFNQTDQEGQYIVRTCNNVSREIYVQNEDDNMWIAIVIGLCLLNFMLYLPVFLIKSKKFESMRAFFMLFAILMTLLLSGILPVSVALNPTDSSTFLPVAYGFLSVNLIVLCFFIYLYGYRLVLNLIDYIRGETKEDE